MSWRAPNGPRLSCGANASGRKHPALRYELVGAQTDASSVLTVAAYNRIILKLPPNVAHQGHRGIQLHFTPFDAHNAVVHLFLKDGAPLPWEISVETTGGPVVEMKCELPADIAFGEGEILEGEPVLKTLHEFLDVTNAIVEAFRQSGPIG